MQATTEPTSDRDRRAPTAPMCDARLLDVRAIIEWLASDACHALDDSGLAAAVGRRLRDAGLPLDRLGLHLRTLHPEHMGRSLAWSPGADVEVRERGHDFRDTATRASSPVRRAMDRREWVTVKCGDCDFAELLRFEEFRDRGLGEVVIAPLVHAAGPASAASFGTTRADGFTAAERRLLARLVPALRSACELRLVHEDEAALLDTYLGAATGRRVLSGRIRRGEVESLEAALFLCDLRDFTALADRLPGARVLALLNLYFDQVVPAIETAGGEILKFMGDAVLAYFSRHDAAASCAAAFAAAETALARLAARTPADAPLRAGIALHYGTVSYGNIGSGHRLDFTVIGRDVNLTSRIETLCAPTGRPLLASARFADLLDRPRLVSVGRYPLRGVAEPVELFAPAAAR